VSSDERPAADVRGRAYRGEAVTVYFDGRRCIHARECVRGLPGVFDTSRRPWIAPEGATAEAVAEVVLRCPSGALTFDRHDGGAAEVALVPTSIAREPGGPLHVRGDLLVATADGERRVTRSTLCACGKTQNGPFCDGSHRGG
jgi:uncharacterized Fe-S cluster protein YjdI